MTMVLKFLRQLRRSLQIKSVITNAPCVLEFATQPKILSIPVKKIGYLNTYGVTKKAEEVAQKKEQ